VTDIHNFRGVGAIVPLGSRPARPARPPSGPLQPFPFGSLSSIGFHRLNFTSTSDRRSIRAQCRYIVPSWVVTIRPPVDLVFPTSFLRGRLGGNRPSLLALQNLYGLTRTPRPPLMRPDKEIDTSGLIPTRPSQPIFQPL